MHSRPKQHGRHMHVTLYSIKKKMKMNKSNQIRKSITFTLSILCISVICNSQSIIPLDTTHWDISAKAYVLENYKGKDAIYIQQGIAMLKDTTFINGTIEFDVFLTERQSFPGVRFRVSDDNNMESFFLRPHLSGKPDANQAAPVINGLTAWQLYFGPKYSFPYAYNFDDWTHIKLVINDNKGQVYLDYAKAPHLSWDLVHTPKEGMIGIGGSFAPVHYANFKINKYDTKIEEFKAIEREALEDIILEWEISDMFEENSLSDLSNLQAVINRRIWDKKIQVEENTAANISRAVLLYGETPGNTVFAKIIINSDKDQVKLFKFGYSDRAVAILNGNPIYKGTNKWRSRDYRYLGTIGLFDAVYLNLKKGDNTLLFAVSEDFGGWLITGQFEDEQGIIIK